jgi:uncharacterized protein YfbU (UPF0304 family)
VGPLSNDDALPIANRRQVFFLGAQTPNSRYRAMKISDGEKLILLVLADLYKGLKLKKTGIDAAFIERCIALDHLWAINWKYIGIPFTDGEDPPEVKETVDILDMWLFLEEGHKKLKSVQKKRVEKEADPFGKPVRFEGFDGNHESEHLAIARTLVDDLDRFTSLKIINSHSRTLDGYRRMYAVFEPMKARLGNRSLSADEIIEILKARKHPTMRV